MTHRASTGTRAGRRGFTLVEVLIALALLSMLMVVLTGAMRTMGQTETRVAARLEEADHYRTTVYFLRDVLAHVSLRTHDAVAEGGPPQAIFFNARADALEWIGHMPARYGVGGRHYMRLAVEVLQDSRPALVLRYAPWHGKPTFNQWAGASAQVLAVPVDGLALRYQHPVTGEWLEAWTPPPDPEQALRVVLPSAVAIQVDGPHPAWPLIQVELLPPFASDPAARRGGMGD